MFSLFLIAVIILTYNTDQDPGTGVGPSFTALGRVIGCIFAFSGFVPPLMYSSVFKSKKDTFFRVVYVIIAFTIVLCIAIPFGFNAPGSVSANPGKHNYNHHTMDDDMDHSMH